MALPPPNSRQTCVVTGASSGIGVEIARRLAERGYGVTLVARREDRLRTLADELARTHRVRTEYLGLDATDPAARARLPGELDARGLSVAGLVNNAGFSTTGPARYANRDRELALVRTDVEAVVDFCTLFLPGMTEAGMGAILNTASTSAFQPLPGQAAYSAAKAFVLAYSQALHTEQAGTGVSVTALCPGPVRTEFNDVAGVTDEEVAKGLPRFMWVPAESVARQGVDAMVRGKPLVIPGKANAAGAVLGHLAPNRVVLPIVARQLPGMRSRPASRPPTTDGTASTADTQPPTRTAR
jgi:uncharacterized protein